MPGFAVFTYHFTTFSYIGKDMTALLLTSFLLGVQVSGLFRLCYFSKWLNDLGKGIFIPELSLSSNENKCPLTGIEEEIKRLHSNSFTLDENMILFTCEVLAVWRLHFLSLQSLPEKSARNPIRLCQWSFLSSEKAERRPIVLIVLQQLHISYF